MRSNKKILIVAVVIALLVTGITYYYISYIGKNGGESIVYVQVVTATDDIPAYTTITNEMLTYESIPSDYVNEEAMQSKDDVVGGMATTDLVKGEQILSSRISTDSSSADMSYRIDENMRAITIPVTEITGIAGFIEVGDKVDLLIGYTEDIGEDGEGIYTQLQNIEVLAVGTTSEGSTSEYSSLTLMVTPEQAEVVAYGVLNAYIQCTLRNPADDIKVDLEIFGEANFDSWTER